MTTFKCVRLEKLLSEVKSILVFYGLSWYRYSHFELLAWQEVFEHISNSNTKVLAIYAEAPDSATIVKWKTDQETEVLCDAGNKVANQFGLGRVDVKLSHLGVLCILRFLLSFD